MVRCENLFFKKPKQIFVWGLSVALLSLFICGENGAAQVNNLAVSCHNIIIQCDGYFPTLGWSPLVNQFVQMIPWRSGFYLMVKNGRNAHTAIKPVEGVIGLYGIPKEAERMYPVSHNDQQKYRTLRLVKPYDPTDWRKGAFSCVCALACAAVVVYEGYNRLMLQHNTSYNRYIRSALAIFMMGLGSAFLYKGLPWLLLRELPSGETKDIFKVLKAQLPDSYGAQDADTFKLVEHTSLNKWLQLWCQKATYCIGCGDNTTHPEPPQRVFNNTEDANGMPVVYDRGHPILNHSRYNPQNPNTLTQ